MLLRPYIHRMGKIKFYAIMGAPMVYYLINFPLFVLGYFTPTGQTDVEVMNNIIIYGFAATLSGIIFGAGFLSVARTLNKDNPLRRYMMIAAYGFHLVLYCWHCNGNSACLSSIWLSFYCFCWGPLIYLIDGWITWVVVLCITRLSNT